MLEVLPLHALREEDGPYVGSNLFYLSKLAQNDFPVAEGIVILPPEFALKTVLSHLNLKDREIFEQRLEIIKSEVKKIPIPEILEKELLSRHLDSHKLWRHLLDSWTQEIRSKIWREGLGRGVTDGLSAHPVLFTGEIPCWGKAYFDYESKKVEIEIQKGSLNEELQEEIVDLVKSANKKLLLPFVYDWIQEGKKIKITKLNSFTQLSEKDVDQKLDISRKESEKTVQSTIKIFLHVNEATYTEQQADGYYLTAPNQLFDISLLPTNSHIIYQLSDTQDQFGGVKGTLKLIHSSNLLKKEADAIKIARHKNGLLNCHISIPYCRSVDEFLELKRQLMSLGLSRSGNLQYLLELPVPENFLNLENYIEAGFDAAILDLDSLAGWLGGFDPSHHDSFYYNKQISALVKFIGPAIKLLHKHLIPIIVKGQLALHDDVLRFLLENGIWGLVLGSVDASMIHQRLRILEQRMVKHQPPITSL